MYRPLIVSLALVAACASPEKPDAKTPASTSAPASATSAPASAAPMSAPPAKARLTRKTGKRPGSTLPPVETTADEVFVQDGAVFIQIAMPAQMDALLRRVNGDAVLQVGGDRHGFAVPAAAGRSADRPLAYVRLMGKAVPASLEVTWTTLAQINGPAGVRQVLKITTAGAAERATLPSRFYRAAEAWFRRRAALGSGRAESFHAFATARMKLLGEEKRPGGTPAVLQRNRRGSVADAMALYTGWTSVEEALQTDRGLRAAGGGWTDATLPLATVKGVSLPNHPWAALQTDAPAPVIEPLAAWVPADFVYLHFSDLRQMVSLMDEMSTLITPVIRLLEAQPGTNHFTRRYERQLAVRRSVLSKTFGNQAARSVALVASDPFLREGSDLSLLFHIKSKALLEGTLARYAKEAQAERPDARESTYALGDHTVRLLSTADRAVERHQLVIDDVLIISNSRAALSRIVAAKAGTTLALAQSGDFRYFRSLYPYSDAEMGYGFLSDAFVLNAISPRTKILQARRVMAKAAMAGVNFAMLLYGWLQGVPANDVKPALAMGLLQRDDLKTPGGEPIRWTPKSGAYTTGWGRPAALRPLIELELETVTNAEAKAYQRFERTYQQYWRGFIDPIGVRLMRRADGGLDIDARMMPLIRRSEYAELAQAVGTVRLSAPPAAPGLRFTSAVAADSRLRRSLDQMGKRMTRKNDVGLGWLGDWVSVGMGEGPAVWDMALSMGNVPSAASGRAADRDTRDAILRSLPVFVGAHVKNKLALTGTLVALKAMTNDVAPGIIKWETAGAHREVPIVSIQENFTAENGLKLHYAIVKDQFWASLDRATLTRLIDAALDAKPITSRTGLKEQPGEGQAVLDFSPTQGGDLGRTILGLLELGAVGANRAAVRGYSALARGRPGEAITTELALAHLGIEPLHANGGTYTLGADGLVQHSLYGSEYAPSWPPIPVAGAAASTFLQALAQLRMTVGFEGEGISRGLHSTVRWARRP